MKTTKLLLVSTIAAALGLAVALWATPAAAHHCKGQHDHVGCVPDDGDGGGGGDQSGKALKLKVTIEGGDTVLDDDDNNVYIDREGAVTANTGGETQPNGPGFGVFLKGNGKNPRMATVANMCIDDVLLSSDVLGCKALPLNEKKEIMLFIERAAVGWRVRPYEVKCPDPDEDGCLDVFEMAENTTEPMSYRISFDGAEANFIIEFASAIGGAGGPTPGRCLSLLSDEDRAAFLNEYCPKMPNNEDGHRTGCDVLVTAKGKNQDGRNNYWSVSGTGLTGLICRLGMDSAVYGIYTGANVDFTAVEN